MFFAILLIILLFSIFTKSDNNEFEDLLYFVYGVRAEVKEPTTPAAMQEIANEQKDVEQIQAKPANIDAALEDGATSPASFAEFIYQEL